MPQTHPIRTIELLIDTSTSWSRGLIDGVMRYALEVETWKVGVEPCGRSQRLRLGPRWRGDGVIARVNSRELAKDLIDAKVPAVNVSWHKHGLPKIPQCTTNEVLTGEIIADHLLERGLRQFAYFGTNRPDYVDRLGQAFTRTIKRHGFTCHSANVDHNPEDPAVRNNQQDTSLIQWLKLLPKPVGLCTWSDTQGRRITEACRAAGVGVPEEIAVISGEHDELMGRMSQPMLTSVDPGPERVGYAAAQLLERMIDGEPPPARAVMLPPVGILARQSTDSFAVPDDDVAGALRYIREHLGQPIGVDDVARHTGISRRGLELRFKQALGRSPAHELRRCRIERAKQLILNTKESLGQIGKACGYPQQETFTRAFTREMQMSPSAFRKMARPRDR